MSYEYYDLLGVSREASADEIKKAYRKAAMENHPDRHGGDKEKEAKFKQINEAYATLSDPQKKAHYDRFGTADMGGGGGFSQGGFDMNFDFGDIFETFFSQGGNGSTRRRPWLVGEDLELRVRLTFAEALSGVKKTVKYKRLTLCDDCHGSGAKPGTEPQKCHVCHGAGQVRKRVQTFFGVVEQAVVCDVCEGTGSEIVHKCPKCHGTKRIEHEVEKEIDVPAGIDDGMTIKMRSEGNEGEKNQNGDLYILFSIPDSVDGLVRDGNDLRFTLELDPVEAVLGVRKQVKIPVLGDRTIELKAGTQHSEIIRFRGDGVKHVSRDQKGDLFVEVQIRIPTKISSKERELYEQIAREKKLDVADHKGIFGKLFGE